MNENRLKKLNKLLSVEIAKLLKSEIEFEIGVIITVTGVKISSTLEHATIMISVLPEDKEKQVFEKIKKEIYFMQQVLNKRLNMRPVPKIRFEVDRTEEKAIRIEKLLEVKDGE